MSGSEEGKAHELVIIRRRGHDEEGGHHGGVWKIAYADFMTAMMAFFLVMWLINSTDKKTLTQVATYFNPMRLTDKKPSTKGLEEPDGRRGQGQPCPERTLRRRTTPRPSPRRRPRRRRLAKSARAESPSSAELEDQEQKQSGRSPAPRPARVQRQAGGRAYRDPFDAVDRSEISPSEPTNGRPSRNPPAAAPQTAGRDAPAAKLPRRNRLSLRLRSADPRAMPAPT